MSTQKSARISPESRPIAFTAVGVAALIYSGAFMASFFGLASLAAFMAIPAALQYVVPAVIDLALILFTLATLLRRARGLSTWKTNAATAFWILVSMAANTSHVLVAAGPASDWGAGTYAGAALSALMPLSALGASLVLENLLVDGPRTLKAQEPAVTEDAEAAVPAAVTAAAAQDAEAVIPSAVPAAVAAPLPEPARPALRSVPKPVVAAATPAAPARPKDVAVTGDRKSAWAAASRSEQISMALEMRGSMSIPKIAAEVGTSVSTVKRLLALAA